MWRLALILLWLAAPAWSAQCEDMRHNGIGYTVCTVLPAQEELRLFLYDKTGDVHGHFASVDEELAAKGQQLGFAMNAGMYHDDRAPVGHYVEDGREVMRVVPNAGPGNFGLLPNGVLCLRPGRADVIETLRFQREAPDCTHATQSGPMLVIDGAVHPRFLPDSTSRFVRNGVGTSADGKRAVFAISNASVTFYEFAQLFRDHLKLPNALFLDGNISRLYAPELGRSDFGFALGPIIGTVVPSN
ncbi:MAG: phosphodiester glycosidase family protein [Pseudomonadota bacterium]